MKRAAKQPAETVKKAKAPAPALWSDTVKEMQQKFPFEPLPKARVDSSFDYQFSFKASNVQFVENFSLPAERVACGVLLDKHLRYFYTGQVCTDYITGTRDKFGGGLVVVPTGKGFLFSSDHKRCLFANFKPVPTDVWCTSTKVAIPLGTCTIYNSDGTQLQGRLDELPPSLQPPTSPGAAVYDKCAFMNSTFVQYDTATGTLISTQAFEANKRHGPSRSCMLSGYKFEGQYNKNKRHGTWRFTEADGSWYTTEYSNGEEILAKRSAVTRPTVDGDERASPEITEEVERIVFQKREQRERAFLNKTAEEFRNKCPDAVIATEHPVGSKSVDLFAKHGDTVAIGEFKASIKAMPHAVGQVQFYRHFLCEEDGDVAEARDDGKLVTFVAMPSKPDANDIKAASAVGDVTTWWPGQPVPF